MAWNFEGVFYENCSCDAICPCTWSNGAHRATQDYCRAAIAFTVDRGEVDGLDVSGRTMVMVIDTPPNMLEGNWDAALIIDDGASEEQAEALGAVMSGAMGGPPAALGPLLGNFLGVERMPITIDRTDGQHHVVAGDALDFTGTPELSGGGDPVRLTNVDFHPFGPTVQVASVAEGRGSVLGIEWAGTDLSGFTGPYSWSS